MPKHFLNAGNFYHIMKDNAVGEEHSTGAFQIVASS